MAWYNISVSGDWGGRIEANSAKEAEEKYLQTTERRIIYNLKATEDTSKPGEPPEPWYY